MKTTLFILVFILMTTSLFAGSSTSLFPELDSVDSYYLAVGVITLTVGAITALLASFSIDENGNDVRITSNPYIQSDFAFYTTISATALFTSFINFTYAFGDDNRNSSLSFTFINRNKKPYPEITLDLGKFALSGVEIHLFQLNKHIYIY